MLNTRWMLLIFLFCRLPDVMGNDVYDLREGRNVWILETEVFDWTPRKPACRTGSALESNFQPFSPFLSSLSAQGMKNTYPNWHPHTRLPTGAHSHAGRVFLLALCVIWGGGTTMSTSFWCALAVSLLEGSASIAVVLPLVQRAPSIVGIYKSD